MGGLSKARVNILPILMTIDITIRGKHKKKVKKFRVYKEGNGGRKRRIK